MQTFTKNRFQKGTLAAPDRILVATDLTDGAYLIPHAVAQARASKAHVTLVHAILPASLMPIEAGALTYVEQEKIDEAVRSILLGIAAQIQSQGIACDAIADHGFAADVIQEQIKHTGATRLIMATHGRRKLAQMALGSVADELIRNVNIPIFAVGPHARETGDHSIPRRILYPVSLLGDYAETAEFAVDLAQANRAELTFLHVLDPDTEEAVNPGRTLQWATNALSALDPDAADIGAPIRTCAVCGNRVEEILRAAARTEADWIVMGVDSAFPFWHFRDTTAYKVLARAQCPVLTVRHEPRVAEKQAVAERGLPRLVRITGGAPVN